MNSFHLFLGISVFTSCVQGYSQSDAYYAVAYSFAAYEDNPQNYEFMPATLEVQDLFDFPIQLDTVFGYIGVDHTYQRIVASFRGTNSITQLISEFGSSTAFTFTTIGVGDAVVIDYFFDAWTGIDNQGFSTLMAIYISENPTYKVWVTGHSLGGALASIAGLSMALNGVIPTDSFMYTFGQPRTGNFAYAQLHESTLPNTWRVVNNRDIVAHLPPCGGISGVTSCSTKGPYHHGAEVWYTAHDNTPMCDSVFCPEGESMSCSDGLIIKTSQEDHHNYVEILGQGFCGTGIPMDSIASVGGGSEADYMSIILVVLVVAVVAISVLLMILRRRRGKAENVEMLLRPREISNDAEL